MSSNVLTRSAVPRRCRRRAGTPCLARLLAPAHTARPTAGDARRCERAVMDGPTDAAWPDETTVVLLVSYRRRFGVSRRTWSARPCTPTRLAALFREGAPSGDATGRHGGHGVELVLEPERPRVVECGRWVVSCVVHCPSRGGSPGCRAVVGPSSGPAVQARPCLDHCRWLSFATGADAENGAEQQQERHVVLRSARALAAPRASD